jgi:hypothetical protein
MVQNGIFSRYLKIILLHVSVLNFTQILYLEQYQTDNFVLKNDIKLNVFESNRLKIKKITLCKSRFFAKNDMKLIFYI